MKQLILLLFAVCFLSAAPSAVAQSETQNFISSSTKSISTQTKETGVMLAVVGISFMIVDILVSGFTILGVGGVVLFISGAVMFFNVDMFDASSLKSLIIAFSVVSIGFFILAVRQFVRLKSVKIVTGSEEIIGSSAQVVEVHGKEIHVLCHGEIWSAESENELTVGQRVIVVELSGLVLKVKPMKE